eukprot:TRINITY_DN9922_c0_g1_i1.p1 TRINITY_DN9922_c0_g1~~TRINITY_DN9922_c0_g1_i1.p1  ORF type:complete len:160 (-),score=26.46 TRINITY_DN9922_c0_g1_i1:88-567(-)
MALDWLPYLTVCIFGWGMSVFIMGFLGKTLPFETAMFYQTIGSMTLTLMINVSNYASTGKFVPLTLSRGHVYAMINGMIFAMADISYYKLGKTGLDISSIGPMSALYIFVPVILGVFVLGEPFTIRKALGLLMAFGSIFLLASDHHNEAPEESKDARSV